MRVPADGRSIVATAPVPRRARRELARLAGRDLNFAPVSYPEAEADPSWHVDRRRLRLPREAPGPAADGGVFATARAALIGYEFADPRIVRAVFDASTDLDGRDMLLVGRFLGLRFLMGVRAGRVVDGTEGSLRRFAWRYRTLERHLEQGQMDYELVKHLGTGEVEFSIRAYSRRAPLSNPLVRLGFALFARREQLRFYDAAVDRLGSIVTQRTSTVLPPQ